MATGRLSSSNPNLQNVPTSHDMNIRAAFQATDDRVLISADYSQIELRILAKLSEDTALLNAFTHDQDIHQQTAAFLFKVDEDQVTPEQRNIGKRINFSVLYGLTPYSLAGDLNIPFKDAKQYIESYFERYAAVKAWMEKVVESTKSMVTPKRSMEENDGFQVLMIEIVLFSKLLSELLLTLQFKAQLPKL